MASPDRKSVRGDRGLLRVFFQGDEIRVTLGRSIEWDRHQRPGRRPSLRFAYSGTRLIERIVELALNAQIGTDAQSITERGVDHALRVVAKIKYSS